LQIKNKSKDVKMKTIARTRNISVEPGPEGVKRVLPDRPQAGSAGDVNQAFDQLEQSVHAALETYSNVHRGSGQASQASTHLYEQARAIALKSLGLDKQKNTIIF
jgi:hypothetical protein